MGLAACRSCWWPWGWRPTRSSPWPPRCAAARALPPPTPRAPGTPPSNASAAACSSPLLNGTRCPHGWDYGGLPALAGNLVTEWDLVCERAWEVTLEQTLFLLGFACGYLGLGQAADSVGRRGVVLLALGLAGPCGVAGAAAGSPPGLTALRFLLGFLLAGANLGLYLIRLELCEPSQRLRATMAGELVGVGGQFLLLGLALACKEWRLLQRLITAPCALFLLYGWPDAFLESARWLLVARRPAEAQAVLRVLARRNRPRAEALGDEAEEALRDLENTCPLPAAAQISLSALLSCRNTWKNLLILGFTTFIAHGLRHCYQPAGAAGRGAQADFYLRSLLGAGTAAQACVFLGVTVDRYGRRGVLLLTMTLAGIASLVLLGLRDYLNDAAVTAFAVLRPLLLLRGAVLSVLLAAEVIPTSVRGRGLGLIAALGALGGLSAPLQRLHSGHGAFLQHVVLAACALLCILSIMLLPESKRKPLPEALRDGELCRRPSLLRPQAPGRCDHVPLLATPTPAL
ncbi:LOW QUALITY PROTEIN: solute carrier family 22 member 17 [Ornithorhynchus anatinus]|uniref:LOW QUALITY PROTEIN: solute carrier family 22 member 17 n=1 Tax=Ornithorhynchus anatinus TaxID=9258 RepID=UPI0010A93E4B|nr:LOW QUALITY PROTEIN: solute carrier family 22 member 17 [Ornithorhynchus anatinus]